MPLITLNRIERRRLTVFFTCFIVALLTWLFIALSGRYKYKVDSKISYIDPPDSKAYHPLQDDSVSLEIEGTGWQLLFSRLRLNPQSVNVSLKGLNVRNYVVCSNQLADLNSQFESSQKVISVSPDTLFFDFSKRTIKKVPVRFVSNLTFEKNFGISGPVKLTPSHVVINGAADDLRKIWFWPTVPLNQQNLSATFTVKLAFAPAKSNNVDVYPLSVKAEIPVDKFTEKVIEVPVQILNARGKNVKILPEKVKVTILTSLHNYPLIERDSLKASVDLNEWTAKGVSQLPVVLGKFPRYSKLVKIEPQVVDFYIRK